MFLPKENVTALMMLYKNTKVKDIFDIVAGVLQGDTLAQCLLISNLDNAIQTLIDLMKENGFTEKKARSRRYQAQTIMDVDLADNGALLVNTFKSLLQNLEKAAGGRDLYVNAEKQRTSVSITIKQETTLRGRSLKLVVKFSCLGSSVSSNWQRYCQ